MFLFLVDGNRDLHDPTDFHSRPVPRLHFEQRVGAAGCPWMGSFPRRLRQPYHGVFNTSQFPSSAHRRVNP